MNSLKFIKNYETSRRDTSTALIFFLTVAVTEGAADINCEKVEQFREYKSCCFFNGTAVISARNVTVDGLENRDVDAIVFDDNKQIEFLFVNVYEKFPSL